MHGVENYIYSLAEIDHLLKAFETEAVQKKREVEDKDAPKSAVDEVTDTTTSVPNTASISTGGTGPTSGTHI